MITKTQEKTMKKKAFNRNQKATAHQIILVNNSWNNRKKCATFLKNLDISTMNVTHDLCISDIMTST